MSSLDSLVEEGYVSRDVPLGPLTTYKLGGPAAYFAEVDRTEDLVRLAESGVGSSLPVLILGRGSNLVVSDEGFSGLVVRLGASFAGVTFPDGEQTVVAGSAVPLPRLARRVVDSGAIGLEFFVGVPGSVGGAVRQNAGCFGRETADCLLEADVIDLTTGAWRTSDPSGLDLAYRHSNVSSVEVVTSATFRIGDGDTDEARSQMRRITRWRRDHQPGGTLNAGSVFKNPDHISAGELIDTLGLKGLRSGDVEVSKKHANFFVAGANATSADIANLVQLVKDRVFEATGTILEPEIQFVGFTE